MKTCIIYARVSTDKQEVSIDAQLAKGREWATSRHLEVVGEFTDVASGAKDDRQGLAQAIQHACKTKATLVCYSLSRLSRSTIKSIELVTQLSKCGGGFVSLTDGELETVTPTGEFMVTIYASVAQLERRMIGQRTATALRYLRSQGRNIYSKIPYGWELDPTNPKKLIRNDGEHAVIARILDLSQSGKSLGEIARLLNAEKIPTKQGCQWGRGSIYAILKRETATTQVA